MRRVQRFSRHAKIETVLVYDDRRCPAPAPPPSQPPALRLVHAGVDPNAKVDGLPLLALAARNGTTAVARALLDRGADVDCVVKSYEKWTPLHYAAQRGAYDLVELLLSYGADPAKPDKRGTVAVGYGDSKVKKIVRKHAKRKRT